MYKYVSLRAEADHLEASFVPVEQKQGIRNTIVEDINFLLDKPEELSKLHDKILNDKDVVEDSLSLTQNQLRTFFYFLMNGYSYLQKQYDSRVLPSHLVIESISNRKSMCGYTDYLDAHIITPHFIAELAGSFAQTPEEQISYGRSDHMEENVFVSTQSLTTLIAIEEGFHRYTSRVLKIPQGPMNQPRNSDTHELLVKPVIAKGISDLRIPLYALSSDHRYIPISNGIKRH